MSTMKKPRAYAHCFQYGNKIYVFGGRSTKVKFSKKIETLDLDSFEWSTLNVNIEGCSLNFTEALKML